MKPVTENMSDKEHRGVTRELATRAIALRTTGAPTVSARFLEDAALSNAGIWYKAITVGNGAADWVVDAGATAALFTAIAQGEVPASGGGTANFLRADGTWAAVSNPRVFISTQTGAGPWSWSGLNGDAAGVAGYELVFDLRIAAVSADATVVLQINGVVGANYAKGSAPGVAQTSMPVGIVPGGGNNNATLQGPVTISRAKTGSHRTCDSRGTVDVSDDLWPRNRGDLCAWINKVDAIASFQASLTAGAVDADSSVKLYTLMDVP